MRAEEDAERDAIRARAIADAAEAATKLWERGGEIAEQIATAGRRLERAVATTASALQAADRGAANAGDRAAKQSRVLAKRLEEVDGAAVSLCAQLTDALARAVEKGEATTAAATRHKETAARLQKEHEADVKRAKEALKKSKQKEEAAEAKARKEETRAKKAEADAARKKTALEVEVNRLKATIEELALRASSSASDSESPPKPQVQSRPTPTTVQPGQLPPTPAMTLMPPLLHASSRPPWSAPGDSPVTHQLTQELVEDAIPAPAHRVETSLSTIVAGPTAAQTADMVAKSRRLERTASRPACSSGNPMRSPAATPTPIPINSAPRRQNPAATNTNARVKMAATVRIGHCARAVIEPLLPVPPRCSAGRPGSVARHRPDSATGARRRRAPAVPRRR